MTPEQAIKAAIKSYYDGETFEGFGKHKTFSYTKDYFDGIEKDMVKPKPEKKVKVKEEDILDEEIT